MTDLSKSIRSRFTAVKLGISFAAAAILSFIGLAFYETNLTSEIISLNDFYE